MNAVYDQEAELSILDHDLFPDKKYEAELARQCARLDAALTILLDDPCDLPARIAAQHIKRGFDEWLAGWQLVRGLRH